jgi:predicted nuclease of restriction endonuclease-like RecB superfamily
MPGSSGRLVRGLSPLMPEFLPFSSCLRLNPASTRRKCLFEQESPIGAFAKGLRLSAGSAEGAILRLKYLAGVFSCRLHRLHRLMRAQVACRVIAA